TPDRCSPDGLAELGATGSGFAPRAVSQGVELNPVLGVLVLLSQPELAALRCFLADEHADRGHSSTGSRRDQLDGIISIDGPKHLCGRHLTLRTDEPVVAALRLAPGGFLEPAIRIHANSGDDVQGHVDLHRKAFTGLRPYLCRCASPRTY